MFFMIASSYIPFTCIEMTAFAPAKSRASRNVDRDPLGHFRKVAVVGSRAKVALLRRSLDFRITAIKNKTTNC
jgi:hypothetical protein